MKFSPSSRWRCESNCLRSLSTPFIQKGSWRPRASAVNDRLQYLHLTNDTCWTDASVDAIWWVDTNHIVAKICWHCYCRLQRRIRDVTLTDWNGLQWTTRASLTDRRIALWTRVPREYMPRRNRYGSGGVRTRISLLLNFNGEFLVQVYICVIIFVKSPISFFSDIWATMWKNALFRNVEESFKNFLDSDTYADLAFRKINKFFPVHRFICGKIFPKIRSVFFNVKLLTDRWTDKQTHRPKPEVIKCYFIVTYGKSSDVTSWRMNFFRSVLRLRHYERISVENRRFQSNGGRLTQNFR